MEQFLQTEKETLKLRLVAALGAAAGLYVHQEQLSLFSLVFFPLAYMLYVFYCLALRYLLLPRFGSMYLVYVMIVVDAMALVSIAHLTGGVNNPLIILVPVFIVYYSIHLGYLGSFATATVATLGLGGYGLLSEMDPATEQGLAMVVTMFYITAMVSGYLGQKRLQEQAEKQELQELLSLETGARNLLEVTRALNTTLDLNELLSGTARLSVQVTGLPNCVVMLLEDARILVARASNVEAAALGLSRWEDLREEVGEQSLATLAWNRGAPVVIATPEDQEELLPSPPPLRSGTLLCIPLVVEGKPVGIIYSYGETWDYVFTDQGLRLAAGFGDLTAAALANARLYQAAQEKISTLVSQLGGTVQRLERLREPRAKNLVSINGLEIDIAAQRATLAGRPVDLSPTEFRLLVALAENMGVAMSQEHLFRKTWGDVYRGQTNVVDVYIYRLRKKLEEDTASPKRIVTIRGVGYKLAEHG